LLPAFPVDANLSCEQIAKGNLLPQAHFLLRSHECVRIFVDSLLCVAAQGYDQFAVSVFLSVISLRLMVLMCWLCRTAATILGPITKVINLKWKVRGIEHLSVKKTVIMIANHQTSLGNA
jgi:hypothetical protein